MYIRIAKEFVDGPYEENRGEVGRLDDVLCRRIIWRTAFNRPDKMKGFRKNYRCIAGNNYQDVAVCSNRSIQQPTRHNRRGGVPFKPRLKYVH